MKIRLAFRHSLECLNEEDQARFCYCIARYALYGIEPNLDGFEHATWNGFRNILGSAYPLGYEFNDKFIKKLCDKLIERAMLKLAWAKTKPDTPDFGSFVWFMKFENVRKLIDGEII